MESMTAGVGWVDGWMVLQTHDRTNDRIIACHRYMRLTDILEGRTDICVDIYRRQTYFDIRSLQPTTLVLRTTLLHRCINQPMTEIALHSNAFNCATRQVSVEPMNIINDISDSNNISSNYNTRQKGNVGYCFTNEVSIARLKCLTYLHGSRRRRCSNNT